ncbi:hypothetical protein F3087_37305 [Nocardia colli]|uniref:Uncharacterized protein n=1 Tax=Nocardia colli TaxID=2545717 RepID=A0A5N0E669_9NOCA|nr:hypothetical protein [Nocardia colli]KAA8883909.1 hypothetical protein F3087_37305 [Nocardia colli]
MRPISGDPRPSPLIEPPNQPMARENMESSERRRRARDRPVRTQEQIDRLTRLNEGSRSLLDRLADRLGPETLAQYRTYSDVGEWGELVDGLCASLVKRRIAISPAERDSLAELMAMFENREGYVYLSDPEGVLSRLVVASE